MALQPVYAQGVPIIGIQWPWSAAGPAAAWEIDLINEKINLILFTLKGAYKMNPTFGSNLIALLFNNRGMTLNVALDIEIRQSLGTWLPDVRILSTKVTDERAGSKLEGLVTIDVNYEWLGQQSTWTGQPPPTSALPPA
jgi:phage baseplate assembly protein W